MFAKSWFQVEFSYYAIPTPVGPADTIIQRYWTDISPEYQSTRDSFSSLQSRLGSFYFQKLQPDVTDTSQGRSSIFAIKFDGYQNIELTVAELARIPGIDYVSYVNRAAQVAGVDDMREAVRVQQCVLIRLNDPASVQRAIRILELGFNERAQLVDICGRVVRETNENFDSGMLQSLDRGLYFLLSSRGKSAKIKVE